MNDARIQTIQFVDLGDHVLLNGVGQSYIVGGKDQLHEDKMASLI
jgi:hypothetical protein